MNILGVIPARGGSKEIKNKNLLKLNNKTLIEIAIKNSNNSKLINKLVFSSDSKKLIKEAKKFKIDIPFVRPKKLATDSASSFSVLKHAINFFEKKYNWTTDIVVLLQPTTPFRTGKIIDQTINILLRNKNIDAAMTIRKPDYPPYWMIKREGKKLKSLIKNGNSFLSRQKTPTVFQPAGSVYAIRKKFLFSIKNLLPQGNTFGKVVSKEESINIDSKVDYLVARSLSKK